MGGTIREAESGEFLAVVRLLEGALLEIDPETVRGAIEAGDALVCVADGAVRGALVLDDSHVEAIAVRRTHREGGIGSALVEAAADREGELTAEFDPRVREFYEALGFDVERGGAEAREGEGGERCRGRLSGPR